MKNMKRSLVALLALISTSSFAGLLQPTVNLTESAPFRISAGLKGGMKGVVKEDATRGYGLGNFGGGLGFVHNVGADFEYGLSVAFDNASVGPKAIFNKDNKDATGLHMDVALMARYLPELAEGFHFGAAFEIGFGRQLTLGKEGQVAENNKQNGFGDLSFKIGPALNYSFTEAVAIYTNPMFTISNVRFGGEADDKVKKVTNTHLGAALPVGMLFGVTDSVGIFVEAEPRITNFGHKNQKEESAAMETFQLEGTLGVTFAI